MLTTYKELLENYNSSVPTALQLPAKPTNKEAVKISDKTFSLVVKLNDDKVPEIQLAVKDDAVEAGSFYTAWVGGFEGGMGWESNNYYRAMMATLADHGEHTGVNSLGVKAVHSWADGWVKIIVTSDK